MKTFMVEKQFQTNMFLVFFMEYGYRVSRSH